MVVEDGNGRPDTVAAMPKQPVASDPVLRAHRDNQACVPVIRKRNRPAITRMNRAGSQSPSGVLGVCRMVNDLRDNNYRLMMFQSPSGVLGVCRLTTIRCRWRGSRFSPLPGF